MKHCLLALVLSATIVAFGADSVVPLLPPDMDAAHATPEFWIDRMEEPDKILLSATDVEKTNAAIIRSDGTRVVDLRSLPQEFDGILMSIELACFKEPQNLWLGPQQVESSFFDPIRSNILNTYATNTMSVEYGFVTTHANVKILPTEERLTEKPDDPEWDELMNTSFPVNEPVLVYIRTADGRFAWVRNANSSGWIRTEDIALCSSREEWLAAQEYKRFLVVTGNKIYTEPSGKDARLSQIPLRMGTVLEVVDGPDDPNSRHPWYNYYVRIPVRETDGSCAFRTAALPVNRDVHIGWLPLTRANILRQAFKHLGDRYGWGGMLLSQDCSGFLGEVYRCFGLRLPRDSGPQAKVPFRTEDLTTCAAAEKQTRVAAALPGSFLVMPGHIMLLIGNINGRPFVIHDMNRYSGGLISAVSVNDLTGLKRANGNGFVDSLKTIVHFPDEPENDYLLE